MTIYSDSQAAVLADLYQRFIEDPGSLDDQWRGFFADLDDVARAVIEKLKGCASGAAAAVSGAGTAAGTAGRPGTSAPAVRAARNVGRRVGIVLFSTVLTRGSPHPI